MAGGKDFSGSCQGEGQAEVLWSWSVLRRVALRMLVEAVALVLIITWRCDIVFVIFGTLCTLN